MIFSRTYQNAILAMVYLAQHEDLFVPAREIAESKNIPGSYLTKILQRLAEASLLISRRGKGGGFRIARPPEEITLYDVRVSLYNDPFEDGELNIKVEDILVPSPLQFGSLQIGDSIASILKSTSIADVVRSMD